jgi:hypothetical protein
MRGQGSSDTTRPTRHGDMRLGQSHMLVKMGWYAESRVQEEVREGKCLEMRLHDLARKRERDTETERTSQRSRASRASMIEGRVGVERPDQSGRKMAWKIARKQRARNRAAWNIAQKGRARDRASRAEPRNGDERQSKRETRPRRQRRNAVAIVAQLQTRTHGKPWRARLLDDRILRRRFLSDVVQPRMPFGRGLRGVEVVLGVVDPSVAAWEGDGG